MLVIIIIIIRCSLTLSSSSDEDDDRCAHHHRDHHHYHYCHWCSRSYSVYPFWREEHERCRGGWGKGEEQVAEGTGIKPEGEHEQVRELEYRGKSNMWKKRQEKNSVEGGIRRRKAGEECNGRGIRERKGSRSIDVG